MRYAALLFPVKAGKPLVISHKRFLGLYFRQRSSMMSHISMQQPDQTIYPWFFCYLNFFPKAVAHPVLNTHQVKKKFLVTFCMNFNPFFSQQIKKEHIILVHHYLSPLYFAGGWSLPMFLHTGQYHSPWLAVSHMSRTSILQHLVSL